MISKEKICEIKEFFDNFDKDNDGIITIKELTSIMRALGLNPSDIDIQEIVKRYDKSESGKIEFGDYFDLIQQRYKEPESEEELIHALKLSNKEGGGIPVIEIEHILSNIGEKLSREEINEIIKNIEVDGMVNYDDFVKYMLAK
jgi:Ca2+-binding EF-hand superfamily protein